MVEPRRRWEIVFLDKYGRSIGRRTLNPDKPLSEDVARERFSDILTLNMIGDRMIKGGYYQCIG
jgi:hypothetical protein